MASRRTSCFKIYSNSSCRLQKINPDFCLYFFKKICSEVLPIPSMSYIWIFCVNKLESFTFIVLPQIIHKPQLKHSTPHPWGTENNLLWVSIATSLLYKIKSFLRSNNKLHFVYMYIFPFLSFWKQITFLINLWNSYIALHISYQYYIFNAFLLCSIHPKLS